MRATLSILLAATAAAVAIPAASRPAAAHHGWGAYDAGSPQTLTGTVERVQPEGPHAAIRLRAAGGGGKTWEVVLAPPSRMRNRGLPADTLRPGDTVELRGYPHRTREDEIRAEWIRGPAPGAQPVQLR